MFISVFTLNIQKWSINCQIISVVRNFYILAYMTIQDLLKRVARGELSSCGGFQNRDTRTDDVYDTDSTKQDPKATGSYINKRSAKLIDTKDVPSDDNDEEYYYDDIPPISVHPSSEDTFVTNGDENSHGEVYTESPAGVADIMDQLGDVDIVICDNLERALYLSLKYEFVTPLTSLVVVKPDSEDYGEFGEAGLRQRQFNIMFSGDSQSTSSVFFIMISAFISRLL